MCDYGQLLVAGLKIPRLKSLSNHFFTLLPKGLGILGVERISADSLAYAGDGHMVRRDRPDMAVLAILAADLLSCSDDTGPYRSCGSLRNGLPPERPLTLGCKLLIDLLHQVSEDARVHI